MKHRVLIILLFVLGLNSYSQAPGYWESLVEATDTWRYFIPSSELQENWTNHDFDDSLWPSGPGGIGFGDNDDNTQIPENTLSVFIRKNFILEEASKLVSAILYVDFDDGFVAYLNGVEIARANIGIPGTRPAFDATSIETVEPTAVSGSLPGKFVIDNSKLASSIRNGVNTLSLQVHNRSVTSSDLSSTCFLFGGLTGLEGPLRATPSWFIAPVTISSHLPLIVIDTWGGYIPNEPKIAAWIKVIDKGAGQINNVNDPATDFEGNIGIEVRGQSSTMFPKLPYGFETRNQLQEDTSVSLLGMPKESDWILSAPYSDKSLMRNPLSYYLGNRMTYWQPRTRWCELILNGEYQGLYILVEKIKRDKNRVNIEQLNETDLTGDPLSGGYIVKVDKIADLDADDFFRTYPSVSYPNSRRYDYTFVYPKSDEIAEEQKVYLKDFLTELENSLNGTAFRDPVTGFRSYMDERSFAEFEIIQELSNNVDGYRYSTFFHKSRNSDGGKLFAGPLWDFDLCYGNVDYAPNNLATNQWLYTHYGPSEGNTMHWWARLMLDPDYQLLVKHRYSQLRSGPMNTDSIMDYLDNNKTLLGDAINRNFERWPILNEYVWPNSYVGGTYDNELDYLKTWLTERLNWLDSKWLVPLSDYNSRILVKNLSVYPNPFHNSLNISFSTGNTDEISVSISSMQGKNLVSKILKPANNSPLEIQLDELNLPPGIYLLMIYQSGQLVGCTKIVCAKDN